MFLSKMTGSQKFVARIFAVIVVHKMAPHESKSLQTLLVAKKNAQEAVGLDLGILLWDNTPGGQDVGKLPSGVEYHASPENSGLASAYNRALQIASEAGYDWLLTLDHDTALPPDFLIRISQIVRKVEITPSIAAIVPLVREGQQRLSPYWITRWGIPRWFRKGFSGLPAQATFAFNSASTIRVSALRQIGGYNPWFWLDGSDHYTFRQLHRHGKRVFVAADIEVAHDFSINDMKARVSPARYRNVLLAESAFWDLEMGLLPGLERTARLIARVYKHARQKDPAKLRGITYEFLRRRLFWSRARRLQAWKEETREFVIDSAATNPPSFRKEAIKRPAKVSVCMAAYNGEPYVEEQFRSILHQLGERDEVIVVDDASKDRTIEIIRSLNDARIRLIEHPRNCGVVATFEDAVRNATGDIIFLADDDDVWAPNKVEKVLEAFDTHSEAEIVTTGLSMIDQYGLPSMDNLYSNRKKFHATFWQNILRNHFQGSAMAFRSSLLHSILPFPRNVEFLHDHWIGTRNALSGGSVVYIDEPLLLYRRHSQNYTRRMNRARQVKVRLQSLWTNFLRYIEDRPTWTDQTLP